MTSFRLFAGTDVGLRDNNEDNFTVCPDLNSSKWIVPADHQRVFPLAERGCLLVVADGMGGQNAGEVASAIAVDTVQQMFSPQYLTDKLLSKPSNIKAFLRKVIATADENVKAYSETHPEAEGLGSTIIMAWAIGGKAYIAWLGDSRAYAVMPGKSISRLSRDHSYVQQLVDKGQLTEIEAMNHPNSNIITRSLGDNSQKAKADVEEISLEEGLVILLCSDGLCGVCTDNMIYRVMDTHADDLQECKEQLTEMALDHGGSDNITIAMLQIVTADEAEQSEADEPKSGRRMLYGILILSFLVLLVVFGWYWAGRETSAPVQPPAMADTVKKNKTNVKRQEKRQSIAPRMIETGDVKEVGSKENAVLEKAIVNEILDRKNGVAGGENANENGLVESSAKVPATPKQIKE